MFIQIKKKSIPLVLINARVTKKAFDKWNKIEKFSKYIFNKIDIAYPQNLETLKYLKKFQISKIKVIGNLKFSEIKNIKTPSLSKSFIKQINNKKVWCGSSTHADEELICAKTHINLKKKYKNLLTIIIPRHTNRVEEVLNKIQDLGLNVILHSSNKKNLNNTDIYIVDTYGETQKFYKISNPVFLGGPLSHPEIKKGGQNPIEAARLGAKIIHGPNVGNFKEVYQLFQNKKISYKVNTVFQLTKLVDKLIEDSKNKDLKIKNIGDKILSKTSNEINNLLKNEIKKT